VAGKILPTEILPLVGTYLRQARMARRRSLIEAADRIGISVTRLEEIENGKASVTDVEVGFITTACYGRARGDKIEGLLWELAMEQASRDLKTRQRQHLAVVGDDPKPWEHIRRKWQQ